MAENNFEVRQNGNIQHTENNQQLNDEQTQNWVRQLYTHIHTHIYIYIYIYVCVYNIYIYVCVSVDICVCDCVCV